MTPPTEQRSEDSRTDIDVDAVARALLRRFGTVAVDPAVDQFDGDETERLLDHLPRGHDAQAEHARWYNALEALKTKHDLSFEEFDAIESGANGEALCYLQEGCRFGLAVGRQLRPEDESRSEDIVPVESGGAR